MNLTINGQTFLVVRVYRNSNVAKLENGQYIPLDLFNMDAYDHD